MKVEKNVLNFIKTCSENIGKREADDFYQAMWVDCEEGDISSPIEQILFCALETIRIFNGIKEYDPIEISGKDYMLGLTVNPQKKIGRYRVDFEVTHNKVNFKPIRVDAKTVLVECDSQQFHERSEEERRYEKARDRYLQSKGYKVFHFTGKEIIQKPFEIAAEIIAHVMGIHPDNLELDNGID